MSDLKSKFVKNQYDLINKKAELSTKVSALSSSKNEKRENIREILSDDGESMLRMEKEKGMRSKLNNKFFEENKLLIGEYVSLKNENEETFQVLFDGAQKDNPNITEQEFRNQLNEHLFSILEKTNYKVDGSLSEEEKLNHGWKKIGTSDHVYIYGSRQEGINVLYKNPGIVEYIENEHFNVLKKSIVGEQLFSRKTIQELGLQDKLPSQPVIEYLLKENKEKVIEMFNKDEIYPGFGSIGHDEIGNSIFFFLSNGNVLEINSRGSNRVRIGTPRGSQCSVRLIKK